MDVARVEGRYHNPGGWREGDGAILQALLADFLWKAVSKITFFSCFSAQVFLIPAAYQGVQGEWEQHWNFSTELCLRPGYGEQYLLSLDHWPMGIAKLGFGNNDDMDHFLFCFISCGVMVNIS